MTLNELYIELRKIGLGVVWHSDKKWISIGSSSFANPLLWFDAYSEDYQGSVKMKSINAALFSDLQIKKSLILVDQFLNTPLKGRQLD